MLSVSLNQVVHEVRPPAFSAGKLPPRVLSQHSGNNVGRSELKAAVHQHGVGVRRPREESQRDGQEADDLRMFGVSLRRNRKTVEPARGVPLTANTPADATGGRRGRAEEHDA